MLKEGNWQDILKGSSVKDSLFLEEALLRGNLKIYYTVDISEAEKITITIITDNYTEITRWNYKIAYRYTGQDPIYGEHGLSCHIETTVDGCSHSFLFDFGLTSTGLIRNIDMLKISFDNLEALALSHGHRDHFGGLLGLLESQRIKVSKWIPLYVGEEAFAERGKGSQKDDVRVDHRPPKKEYIESLRSVKVIEIKDPTPIVPGAHLTGRIERVTDYEKVDPDRWVKRGDSFERENFIGEQSVVLNLKKRGLIVLTGCAHAGIVNTIKHVQKITGIRKIHAIMGGFHLTGAKKENIQRTVAEIKAMSPDYIIPMHCTGFEALMAFALEMPDQFILNTVGTKYIFIP